jgi:hypothetical protein
MYMKYVVLIITNIFISNTTMSYSYQMPSKRWWVDRMFPAAFKAVRQRVKAELKQGAMVPSITTDLWTSRTRQAY